MSFPTVIITILQRNRVSYLLLMICFINLLHEKWMLEAVQSWWWANMSLRTSNLMHFIAQRQNIAILAQTIALIQINNSVWVWPTDLYSLSRFRSNSHILGQTVAYENIKFPTGSNPMGHAFFNRLVFKTLFGNRCFIIGFLLREFQS